MPVGDELCRCGHARELHEHLRRGTDCAECGSENCSGYRAVGQGRFAWWSRLRSGRAASDGVVLRYPASGARGRLGTARSAGSNEAAKDRAADGDLSKEA